MYRVLTEKEDMTTNDRETAMNKFYALSMLQIPAVMASPSSILASVGKDRKDILIKLISKL